MVTTAWRSDLHRFGEPLQTRLFYLSQRSICLEFEVVAIRCWLAPSIKLEFNESSTLFRETVNLEARVESRLFCIISDILLKIEDLGALWDSFSRSLAPL